MSSKEAEKVTIKEVLGCPWCGTAGNAGTANGKTVWNCGTHEGERPSMFCMQAQREASSNKLKEFSKILTDAHDSLSDCVEHILALEPKGDRELVTWCERTMKDISEILDTSVPSVKKNGCPQCDSHRALMEQMANEIDSTTATKKTTDMAAKILREAAKKDRRIW